MGAPNNEAAFWKAEMPGSDVTKGSGTFVSHLPRFGKRARVDFLARGTSASAPAEGVLWNFKFWEQKKGARRLPKLFRGSFPLVFY